MRCSGLWGPILAVAVPLRAVPALVTRAVQRLHEGSGEVARRVVTHVDVYNGKETYLGSLETVDALVAWGKDGKPVRKQVSSRQQGSPGFTMSLSLHLEDQPAQALDGFDTWTDLGAGVLQGHPVARFRGTATSGHETTVALAYLDPQTGTPLEVDYDMPMHSLFGTRQVKASVTFGAGPAGTWVPEKATINQAGSYLFWHRRLVVTSTYQDWAPRP